MRSLRDRAGAVVVERASQPNPQVNLNMSDDALDTSGDPPEPDVSEDTDDAFQWTPELSKSFFHLRLQHEWLFKKKKQAWKEFYKVLLDKGFPRSLTLSQVRKKWGYTFDVYKEAKMKNNSSWIYYDIFDQYLSEVVTLDKYESWSEEWRLKLIQAYQASHAHCRTSRDQTFWREVERDLRTSGLPMECCIQDLKGLIHHLKMTFERKWCVVVRRGAVAWPLYPHMLELYERCEPDSLRRLRGERVTSKKQPSNSPRCIHSSKDEQFVWTRDVMESFIQIRLQHEWLFKEKKQPWDEFGKIMQENGYPRMTGRLIQKKWNYIHAEYQKAMASNNVNWIYYNLFQLYLGESTLNLNPLQNWEEHWVHQLIESRNLHHHLFKLCKTSTEAWREVEKDLRKSDIPLDHSLMDIEDVWKNLTKMFKWKSKFAAEGCLCDEWPFYSGMEKHFEMDKPNTATIPVKHKYKTPTAVAPIHRKELADTKIAAVFVKADDLECDDNANDDFSDEDIKPLCSINKVEVAVDTAAAGVEVAVDTSALDVTVCRGCGAREAGGAPLWGEEGIADIFGTIAGVEVEESDGLPDRLCDRCVKQLKHAYDFRTKCQATDRQHRLAPVKIESSPLDDGCEDFHRDYDHPKMESDTDAPKLNIVKIEKVQPKSAVNNARKVINGRTKRVLKRKPKTEGSKRIRDRRRYEYRHVCEICGKNVTNIKEHVNAHSGGVTYSCSICSRTFKTSGGLYLHKTTHSDAIVKTCDVCGKSFKMMNNYKKHYKLHLNERKFKCETCGKKFNQRDGLVVHQRTHSDERPFACPDCGKRFRTAACVSRHRRIVHKIQNPGGVNYRVRP